MLNSVVEVTGALPPGSAQILTEQSIFFLEHLHDHFEHRRVACLQARADRQKHWDNGELPRFLQDSSPIRNGEWRVAPAPAEVMDRRVEITGPVEPRMVINALNSGARVFMADFEDSMSPVFSKMVLGQKTLIEAHDRTLSLETPERSWRLNLKTAVLMVRPRGWHMTERHFQVGGKPISATLFDAGLYLFHNLHRTLRSGTRPYLYLPKMESAREAELWSDILHFVEKHFHVPHGTIRCTALIETLPAAFEMEEILFALRTHILGLNCGRWDYIFSFVKTVGTQQGRLFPERKWLTMDAPFLAAYVRRLVDVCHRRGAHAIGGMSAHIPVKNDEALNSEAMEHVRLDKMREVQAGHDGTWVAHPGLVDVAQKVFDTHMVGPHQITKPRLPVAVTEAELLQMPKGSISFEGVVSNLDVSLLYLSAWLSGKGCVPIAHKMEDMATAEICRAQLWQWCHFQAEMTSGQKIDRSFLGALLEERLGHLSRQLPESVQTLTQAAQFLEESILSERLPPFLTLLAESQLPDTV